MIHTKIFVAIVICLSLIFLQASPSSFGNLPVNTNPSQPVATVAYESHQTETNKTTQSSQDSPLAKVDKQAPESALADPETPTISFYINPNATRNGNGSDWAHAMNKLPAQLERNATYYLASGDYGNYVFDDEEDGSQKIYIRKATASNHGSNNGWDNDFEGAAVFQTMDFNTSYYEVDGMTGNGREGYGIEIFSKGSAAVDIAAGVSDITMKHCNIHSYPERSKWSEMTSYEHLINAVGTDGKIKNLKFQNNYLHHVFGCPFFFRNTKGILIENNYITTNKSTGDDHGEGISASEGTEDMTVRYNTWEDIEGTAFIATPSARGHDTGNTIADWYIYGNVFRYSPKEKRVTNDNPPVQTGTANGVGGGIVYVFDVKVSGDFFIYNNTIVNLRDSAVSGSDDPWTSAGIMIGTGENLGSMDVTMERLYVKNNLWVNCSEVNPARDTDTDFVSIKDLQWSHNEYINTQTEDKEPNKIIGTVNPLVDWANGNYHLKSATSLGAALPSPFNKDADGKTRGSDKKWDRGAFEFGNSNPDPDTQAPSTPTGLAAGKITPNSVTLTWSSSTDNIGVAGYNVLRDGVVIATVTSATYTDSGLKADTAYRYKVKAFDAARNYSPLSSEISVRTRSTPVPDAEPPTVPTGIRSSNITQTSAMLSWTASRDNTAVMGYQILRDGKVIANVTTLTYNDSGLIANTSYNYSIKAYDAAGNYSPVSAVLTVKTLSGVNRVPVAQAQSLTFKEDTSKTITLAATDADGNRLTYVIVNAPRHGTLVRDTINYPNDPSKYLYVPNGNYNGADSFTFKAFDGAAYSQVATVSLTIQAENDAPVATPKTVSLDEDKSKAIQLAATDAEGNPLTYSIVDQPEHGTLERDPDYPNDSSRWIYKPNKNFKGTDSFTFKAFDGKAYSQAATFNLKVNSVNDVPVAHSQTVKMKEDEKKAIHITGTDVERTKLIYKIVDKPRHGKLVPDPKYPDDASHWIYIPDDDYHGSDSFTFTVSDGKGTSEKVTVKIKIEED